MALLVDELRGRPGVTVNTWYLRHSDARSPERGTRVVDSLRTWPPCALLDRLGLGGAAAHLRGLRLRTWLRQVRPDVVVLDDGLGQRVIESVKPSPRIVVRYNDSPPEHLHMEASPTEPPDADLVILPYGRTSLNGTEGRSMVEEFLTAARLRDAGRMADPVAMRAVRRRLGLPDHHPLMVGWGGDGWLDGPDLFIRFLWTLEHHQGMSAHGVWFGLTTDHDEMERLAMEARRCGLGDRFHHLPAQDADSRMCGDGVFLPYRSTVDRADLADILATTCSGSPVVTFEAVGVDDPMIRRIANLDLELAAAAMVEGLRTDRSARSASARRRFEALPEEILALGSGVTHRR